MVAISMLLVVYYAVYYHQVNLNQFGHKVVIYAPGSEVLYYSEYYHQVNLSQPIWSHCGHRYAPGSLLLYYAVYYHLYVHILYYCRKTT